MLVGTETWSGIIVLDSAVLTELPEAAQSVIFAAYLLTTFHGVHY